MDNLPPSVLVQIFSHLEVKDKCKVARVCKSWREFVGDKRLWKNVNFFPCRVDLPAHWGALRRYFTDGLHTLHLRGFRFASRSENSQCLVDAVLMDICRRCPNIVELHIDEADLSAVDSGNLPPTLEVLALCECVTTPGWFQAGVTKGRLDRLQNLSLEKNKSICDRDLEDLAFLPDGGKLECLNISYCYRVTERGFKSVAKLTNLRILNVSRTFIEDDGLKFIMSNLKLRKVYTGECCLLTSRWQYVSSYYPQSHRLSPANGMDDFWRRSCPYITVFVVIVGVIIMYAFSYTV